MARPWLSIIGIGEGGLDDLSPAARAALDAADIIFGAQRHLELALVESRGNGGRGELWPIPFSLDPLVACRGQAVAALVSGDPFWYGAGGSIASRFERDEWVCFPAPSTFSLAASRLGWKIEEIVALGLHAAPLERLRPVLSHGMRAIVLVRDGAAAADLASWLATNGFEKTDMAVMEALGGPSERIRHCLAASFDLDDVAHPVAIALEISGPGLSRACGLPDTCFEHDGQITKRPVRALTLSALAPRPGEILWDIGAGSGSVGIEFLLAAPGSRVFAVEADSARAARIGRNAASFGLGHRLQAIHGMAPQALDDLPPPGVVFIGGGATDEVLAAIWNRLAPGGRLVANAVTLESETLLAQWSARLGGSLLRVELAQAEPLGSRRGWRPFMPVVQWSVSR